MIRSVFVLHSMISSGEVTNRVSFLQLMSSFASLV
jgi:hypothetical protein